MEHKQEVKHHDYKRGEDLQIHESEETVSFIHDFIAGGIAGSASVVVGHPFDTLKVRVGESQAGRPPQGNGH